MSEAVNPFSGPCCLVSSLASAAICTIVWSSYGMGVQSDDRGNARYLTGSSWLSMGCCMAILAIAIIKFID